MDYRNSIELPQLIASFAIPLPAPFVMLVAGGNSPERQWFKEISNHCDEVWAVDHGVDICRNFDVVPKRVIGDRDSGDQVNWQWAEDSGAFTETYPPEKDLTDLQLSLRRIGEIHGGGTAILTAAWGGRFDHLWSNVLSIRWAAIWKIRACCMVDEKEVFLLLHGDDAVKINIKKRPEVISLLSLSEISNGVSIKGVRWPLNNVKIHLEQPYAISNRLKAESNCVEVSLSEGWLGVYMKF